MKNENKYSGVHASPLKVFDDNKQEGRKNRLLHKKILMKGGLYNTVANRRLAEPILMNFELLILHYMYVDTLS